MNEKKILSALLLITVFLTSFFMEIIFTLEQDSLILSFKVIKNSTFIDIALGKSNEIIF
jgi:hypothetical protein